MELVSDRGGSAFSALVRIRTSAVGYSSSPPGPRLQRGSDCSGGLELLDQPRGPATANREPSGCGLRAHAHARLLELTPARGHPCAMPVSRTARWHVDSGELGDACPRWARWKG